MSRTSRVFNIVSGVLMIICSWILFRNPDVGLEFAAMILSVSLFLSGIHYLYYYFSMARHMVGGRYVLFTAVFILDFGMFTAALSDFPRLYVVMYLLGYHAFTGLINILRGLEAKRYKSPDYRRNVLAGSFDFLIALGCIIFIRRREMLILGYCLTLAWSAVIRIISAFRRTAVIHIGP